MADLTYEVSFKGVASPTLRAAFVDYELDAGMGVTLVRCTQGSLRTVIARIEEFGLELLDVRLIAEHPAAQPPPPDSRRSPPPGDDNRSRAVRREPHTDTSEEPP